MGNTIAIDRWLVADAGSLPQCLSIFSDEPLFVAETSDAFRARARQQGDIQRHVVEVDRTFNPHEFIGLFSEASLFGDVSLVDCRLSQPKLLKEQAEAFSEIASWILKGQTDHMLLVAGPSLNNTQRKSAGISHLLNVSTEVVCPAITLDNLPAWIKQTAKQSGIMLEQEAAWWLANRCEGNLLAAKQAITKLASEHEGKSVSLDAVEAVASESSRFNVFAMGEQLLKGDTKRVVKILDGLKAEGQASSLVLWCLSEEVRTLSGIAESLRKGLRLDEACRNFRVWGPRKNVIGQALKRHNTKTLQLLKDQCYRAEKAIKGMGPGDPWILLEIIGLGICGVKAPNNLDTTS